MKYSALFFLLLLALACSKSDRALPSNELVGIWRLTTYCKSDGSLPCNTIDVPANKGVFIAFNNNGSFNEFYENTKPAEYSFLGCGSGNYTIEGGNVRIRAVCMSSLQGRLMEVVSVSTNQLVLNPFSTGEYRFVRQ